MKKRLLQITHDLELGGLQQVIVNLCRCIDRDKYDIRVLCLREKGLYTHQLEEINVPVDLLPQTTDTDYFSFIKVARYLKEKKIDIIHTHNTQPLVDGVMGSLFSGRKHHIVHTDHARNFPDKTRYMIAEHLMSYFVYKFVGVSEHTSENLAKYEKISKAKIVTIENGIYGKLYQNSIDVTEKRLKLGIDRSGFVIGTAGRFSEQKGLKYLLKAMPNILKTIPDAYLILAGDGELAPELKKLTVDLGIENRVNFIGTRQDMPDILKVLDIFVLPSIWEGLPMIILEAMAASLPILATDVGGVSRAIKHNRTGLLIPSKDSSEITNKIIELHSDLDLRKRLSTTAHNYFGEEFDASNMARAYEKLYEKI